MAMPLAPLTLAGHVVITRKEKSYTIQTKKGNHTQCYKILIFFSYHDTFFVAYLSRC